MKGNRSEAIDRPNILPGIVPSFLEEYRHELLVIYNRSEKTAFEYSLNVLLFFRFLAHKDGQNESDLTWITIDRLKEVTYKDITDYLYHEAAHGCGPSSRSNKITALRSFYKYLKSEGMVDMDPTEKTVFPKQASTLPNYLTYEEAVQFLDGILNGQKTNRARDYCMVVLFLTCGLRRSELRALDISDVDNNRNVLRIVGKGNKMREIPLNNAAQEAIALYLPIRKNDSKCPDAEKALFVSNQGTRVSPETINKMVKRRLQEAGLDPSRATVHTLRHTFATMTYNGTGGDIRSVQALLGHSSLATTQIYTHVNNKQIAQAVEMNPLNINDRDAKG